MTAALRLGILSLLAFCFAVYVPAESAPRHADGAAVVSAGTAGAPVFSHREGNAGKGLVPAFGMPSEAGAICPPSSRVADVFSFCRLSFRRVHAFARYSRGTFF